LIDLIIKLSLRDHWQTMKYMTVCCSKYFFI